MPACGLETTLADSDKDVELGGKLNEEETKKSHIIVNLINISYLPGSMRFNNNSKPKGYKLNFKNIKTQCYFKLAELINANALNIRAADEK